LYGSDLTSYKLLTVGGDTAHFYPCVLNTNDDITAFVNIYSKEIASTKLWKQNHIKFALAHSGWLYMPARLHIYEHVIDDINEVTIFSICHDNNAGNNVIYLRGGLNYIIESNIDITANTSTITLINETFPVLDTNGVGAGFNNVTEIWDKNMGIFFGLNADEIIYVKTPKLT